MSRKFILGYMPGTKSPHFDGPKPILRVVAEHNMKRYEFDRFERDPGTGLFVARLALYDWTAYPEKMLLDLEERKQIVRVG